MSGSDIKVFGVTALTSLSDNDTNEIYRRSVNEQVNAMLDLAESACIDGVVCSPHELEIANIIFSNNKINKWSLRNNYFVHSKENYLIICKNQTCSNKIKTLEELKAVVKNYAI